MSEEYTEEQQKSLDHIVARIHSHREEVRVLIAKRDEFLAKYHQFRDDASRMESDISQLVHFLSSTKTTFARLNEEGFV